MQPLLGLRTAFYAAPDIVAARDWYARALGVSPYFDEPFYVGFSVGGYELGLVPDETPNSGGVAWGVAEIHAAFAHFLEMGAVEVKAPADVGGGIWFASVRDPFGNVLGLIENPHFKL
ncbi:glyoxalase [Deltaproteobacteria bacterium]|nr:glyoxalase [Deltaproteobacteria bacterium]